MMSVVVRLIALRSYHFVIAVWSAKEAESARMRYREIIADNLSKSGWSWGCVSAVDSEGRTLWIVDAHRDDGKRFISRGAARNRNFFRGLACLLRF